MLRDLTITHCLVGCSLLSRVDSSHSCLLSFHVENCYLRGETLGSEGPPPGVLSRGHVEDLAAPVLQITSRWTDLLRRKKALTVRSH